VPDKFTSEVRSQIMAAIKQKNTKTELALFKGLRDHKIKFQKHYKKATGTPDIAIPSKKLAIFIDGDFWHGYRYPKWKKRLTSPYWISKIEGNMARDKRTSRALKKSGWTVLRFWEHDIKKNLQEVICKIDHALSVQQKKL
jgi:DNA mismatch endonuclease (patch repair protein)